MLRAGLTNAFPDKKIFPILPEDCITMKTDRQVLLAITTFTILGLLVLIQVGWIFRAANLEKQNFKTMVLHRLQSTN